MEMRKIRPWTPEIFYAGEEVTETAMWKVVRRIDENYSLWGRNPRILGKVRRMHLLL